MDAADRRRLEFYQPRTKLQLIFTDAPLEEADVDVYVVRVDGLGLLFGQMAPGDGAPSLPCTPIIAYGEAESLRPAFVAGCVDYVKEPWLPDEFDIRIELIADRQTERYRFPWGAICLSGSEMMLPSGKVGLTRPEAAILRLLLMHRGKVVTRDALFYAIRGELPRVPSRAVDVHVGRLRKKLAVELVIASVRGQGYLVR